jgi:hypothetical protein
MSLLEFAIYFFQSIGAVLTLGYRRPLVGTVILIILLAVGFGFYRSFANDRDATMPAGGLILVYGLISIYALATLWGLMKRLRHGRPPLNANSPHE